MRDGTDTLGDIPPISLSKHYFNLGQTDVDVENLIQTIPHSICLTNHNHSNLLITWEKGNLYIVHYVKYLFNSFVVL